MPPGLEGQKTAPAKGAEYPDAFSSKHLGTTGNTAHCNFKIQRLK